jgi:hypothetical protein
MKELESQEVYLDYEKKDSNILSLVIEDMRKREDIGKIKYGTTMDRNDLSTNQWLLHIREELMDAILYLKKLELIQNEGNKDKIY